MEWRKSAEYPPPLNGRAVSDQSDNYLPTWISVTQCTHYDSCMALSEGPSKTTYWLTYKNVIMSMYRLLSSPNCINRMTDHNIVWNLIWVLRLWNGLLGMCRFASKLLLTKFLISWGRWGSGCNYNHLIFNLISLIGIFYGNAFRLMPWNLTEQMSKLIQIMAWYHQGWGY